MDAVWNLSRALYEQSKKYNFPLQVLQMFSFLDRLFVSQGTLLIFSENRFISIVFDQILYTYDENIYFILFQIV